MNLVRKGYKMGFQKSPQLSKPLSKFETQLPPQQMELVSREVAGFLKKGAIRVVPPNENAKILSTTFGRSVVSLFKKKH